MFNRLWIFAVMTPWLAVAQTNLTGTWVAKRSSPMGDMETVFNLKVDGNAVSGSISEPFGDMPIIEGKITNDVFELVASREFFGQLQRVTIKGKLVGDELRVTMPGPGMGPPGGPGRGAGPGGPGGPPDGFDGPPGGPGGPPPDGTGPGWPQGTNAPAMRGPPGGGPGRSSSELVARRGTPSQPRRKTLNLKSLAKIQLPEVKDLPSNGLAPTPPMGWNSWNHFHTRLSGQLVCEIADAMATNGMKEAGYQYINIDDGWQGDRDAQGVLHANTNFPDMKALADYVHSKGLKLGIYSSPGPLTCAGYEGSYAHEEQDAKTWAEWGVDYLKYDWCSAAQVFTNAGAMRPLFQKMAEALRATGRPIVYSLCQYGREKVWQWGPKAGGHLWRTTGDISDRWGSMARIGFGQNDLADFAGPGQWNDPDMLEIGNGGMSGIEYRTHFSLWAILAAPLIAGNDLRSMSAETKEILLNREVIAIDQDKLGKQGRRVSKDGATEIWTRPLEGGDLAVAIFNRGEAETTVTFKWQDLNAGVPAKIRDLWAHADRDVAGDACAVKVAAHGAALLRAGN